MSVSETQHNFRLLNECEPQSGERNMAIDEALLESTIRTSVGTFRLYRWREPTISLGYFQGKSDNAMPTRFQELPSVRRITGGGAILHHHEITYSITIRRDHPLLETPVSLYDIVHRWITDAFSRQNIEVHPRGESVGESKEPFLCFLRSDPRDLLLAGSKIVGSAQRRRKGVILQHGSIILHTSKWTPEIPGVDDFSKEEFSLLKFREDLVRVAGTTLNFVERFERCVSPTEILNSWLAMKSFC